MKKKLLCGLLCLSFCLPAAKAAERPFSDVMETDWFAPYVAVCAQANILNGTGEGRFSPHRTLTYQECTVLSLRLYDLLRGGDGLFDAPPADWGQMTLSTEAFTLTDHIRNFRTFPQWWEEDMPPGTPPPSGWMIRRRPYGWTGRRLPSPMPEGNIQADFDP